MTPQETIKHIVLVGDYERLSTTLDADLNAAVISILNEYELAYETANIDKLLSIGVGLARNGHENVELSIFQWLPSNPSMQRLNIACILLIGLWQPVFRKQPVKPELVDTLIRIRHILVVDDQTEYDYVQVLCKIIESKPIVTLRKRVVTELLAVSARQIQNQMLKRQFDEIVVKTLKNANK